MARYKVDFVMQVLQRMKDQGNQEIHIEDLMENLKEYMVEQLCNYLKAGVDVTLDYIYDSTAPADAPVVTIAGTTITIDRIPGRYNSDNQEGWINHLVGSIEQNAQQNSPYEKEIGGIEIDVHKNDRGAWVIEFKTEFEESGPY